MKINNAGLNIIKGSESCKLTTYRCPAGVPTIGFGHTGPDVKMGTTITQERADELLLQDVGHFEQGVQQLLQSPVSQNQFSALVSFAFNVGLENLRTSSLLRYVNQGNFTAAIGQFGLWIHANGQVLRGLITRRTLEATLFATPDGK